MKREQDSERDDLDGRLHEQYLDAALEGTAPDPAAFCAEHGGSPTPLLGVGK